MLTNPSGRPTSASTSARIIADNGVLGAGFTTTAQPASNAGASLLTMLHSGAFHGTIAATTPTGSWTTVVARPTLRCSSNGYEAASDT